MMECEACRIKFDEFEEKDLKHGLGWLLVCPECGGKHRLIERGDTLQTKAMKAALAALLEASPVMAAAQMPGGADGRWWSGPAAIEKLEVELKKAKKKLDNRKGAV